MTNNVRDRDYKMNFLFFDSYIYLTNIFFCVVPIPFFLFWLFLYKLQFILLFLLFSAYKHICTKSHHTIKPTTIFHRVKNFTWYINVHSYWFFIHDVLVNFLNLFSSWYNIIVKKCFFSSINYIIIHWSYSKCYYAYRF